MSQSAIINADDLGLSKGTNRGIEKAYHQGILTSASIMPTGPAFAGAVRLVKKCPNLGIGIHLSLNWGKSILAKKKIPDLVDQEGYFYPSVASLFLRTLFKPKIINQIKAEFFAQIKMVQKAGISPDHLDSQFHVHFIPAIFPLVYELAQKNEIKFVRTPLEPLFFLPFSINLLKWAVLQLFGLLLKFQGRVPAHQPEFYGVLATSQMTTKVLRQVLARNKEKPVEILSHPGKFDLERTEFDFHRQGIFSFLKSQGRQKELQALIDSEVKSIIKTSKINLATFAKL